MEPTRNFPFRRALAVDPIIIPAKAVGTPVSVDQLSIRAQGVTSFKMTNPCPFWVFYRGWNGAIGDMPAILDKGHYLGPGATDVNTSQIPQWIAAVACAEPGVPLPSDLATAGYRLVMIYGSGA